MAALMSVTLVSESTRDVLSLFNNCKYDFFSLIELLLTIVLFSSTFSTTFSIFL